QAYREALQLHPAHKPALRGLARALSGIGEYGAAESACRKLIASDSHDAEAWLVLGSVLRARNLPADAESAYRRAIASRPGFAAAHHNLGALLSELERAEEALVELDRARALGLETRESLINRGRT